MDSNKTEKTSVENVVDTVDSSSLTSSETSGNQMPTKIVPMKNEDNISMLLTFSNSRPNALVIILTLVASVSGFLFGYDTGYISSALVSIKDDLGGKTLSYGQKELITSATSLGAFIGAAAAGTAIDMVGRKPIIMSSNVLFIIGSAMQTACHSVSVMMGGRFVMGIGVGIGSLVGPIFIAELAPAHFRGRLVICNVLSITGGQLIAYAIGAGVDNVHNGWRILVGLSMIPPILQFVIFFFLPDTPRYYLSKNRIEDAKKVLLKVYPEVEESLIDKKIEELIQVNNEIPGNNVFKKTWNGMKELHQNPANFRALVISCGLQGIQQFSSWNSLMYFSATIFQSVGFNNSSAVSIVIAGTNFLGTIAAFFIIDRVGRRKMLLYTMPGMIVALILCAIAFHFLDIKFENGSAILNNSGVSAWGIVIIVAMIMFACFFSVGLGNVPWQQSELFPQSLRGLGCSYATATNWVGSLIIAASFLTMLENITPTGTFSFFGGLILLSWIFVYFMYPELSGLELEEVQSVLTGGFNVKASERMAKERKKKYAQDAKAYHESHEKKGPTAEVVEV